MIRIIKKLVIALVLMFVLASPAYASELHLFETDVGNDSFQTADISFDVPETINKNWYPLRQVSAYLPIAVDWDNNTREVVIYSDAVRMLRPLCSEQRYNSKRLEVYKDDVKIIDGVTYCSARFLQMFLSGVGFSYEDSIFCYIDESKSTSYINSGNSMRFRSYVNTSLYELYLKCPDDYQFIKENLPGGISYVDSRTTPYWSALGYVYPYSNNPVCYIVGDRLAGATLSSVIAHEAMHVYQARIGMWDSEKAAEQYEAEVLNKLLFGGETQ